MKIRLMKYIKKYSTMIMVCSLCLNAAFIAIIDGMRDSAEQAFDQLIIAESKMSDIKHDLEDLKAEQEVEQAEAKWTSLGNFKITHYGADCIGCSGITATGTVPQEGRTIAADWSIIPAGTEVMINGNTYIVEDRGGAIQGNVIDMFAGTEAESVERGVYYTEVYIKEQPWNKLF